MAPKAAAAPKPKAKPAQKKAKTAPAPTDDLIGKPCPACGQGTIIKGKTAYGCSRWREGCAFRLPFAERQGAQEA